MQAPLDSPEFSPDLWQSTIRGWLERHCPAWAGDGIKVELKDYPKRRPNAEYGYDGSTHYFWIGEHIQNSPFLTAIIAHETGHCINTIVRPRRMTAFLRFLRGKPQHAAWDRSDYLLLYLTGSVWTEECAADRHALRIMHGEGYRTRLLLEHILAWSVEPDLHPIDRLINVLTRRARLLHCRLCLILRRF